MKKAAHKMLVKSTSDKPSQSDLILNEDWPSSDAFVVVVLAVDVNWIAVLSEHC